MYSYTKNVENPPFFSFLVSNWGTADHFSAKQYTKQGKKPTATQPTKK
jgi:hypothetical protein